MALLIGTLSSKHVVITADQRRGGLEQEPNAAGEPFSKVFPVPGRSMAIVSLGEDDLLSGAGRVPLAQFMREFFERSEVFEQLSLRAVAEAFIDYADGPASFTMAQRGASLLGFWIAGFARGKAKPELFEACWLRDSVGQRPAPYPCRPLVLGGEGSQFIQQYVAEDINPMFRLETLETGGLNHTLKYHTKLFMLAGETHDQQARPDWERLFAREYHQYVIARDGVKRRR